MMLRADDHRGGVQNYRNLIVWQKAHTLAVRVYRVSRRLARLDRSGLASQLQRAALDVVRRAQKNTG
ncbi:MAG: four helix bundle protein [Gemmatimonadaceae bacterium]